MSDELYHWLEELAGRRPADALTQSLRDAVLKQGERGIDELAYRRLLRRLDEAKLLEVTAPPRRFKPALAGFAATMLLAVGIVAYQVPGQFSPLGVEAEDAARGMAVERMESRELAGPPPLSESRANPSASKNALAEKPSQKSNAAPLTAYDGQVRRPDDVAEAARTKPEPLLASPRQFAKPPAPENPCIVRASGAEVIEISVADIDSVLRFYSALDQLEGASFHYQHAEHLSVVRWHHSQAAEAIAALINPLVAGYCRLPERGQLKLRFTLGGGSG